jgi:hypothetical protein
MISKNRLVLCIFLYYDVILFVSRSCFTHFEDLTSEIIYEIFEYFDPYHVYKSFFNINTRFQYLVINSTVRI